MEQLTFNEKMATVQLALKVPKTKNESVPYKSRNAEQILEQAKPLLAEHGLIVTLHPKLEALEGRVFIVSTAIVTDGTESTEGVGIAELLTPAVNKYGKDTMNESQASGATGSYANKYALGAVFGIGESEDADHEKYQRQTPTKKTSSQPSGKITDKQVGLIEAKRNVLQAKDPTGYAEFGEWYKQTLQNKPFKALSKAEASKVIDRLMGNDDPEPEIVPIDDLDEYSGDEF